MKTCCLILAYLLVGFASNLSRADDSDHPQENDRHDSQHEKEGGPGFGGGVNIDLGPLTERKKEPDPFGDSPQAVGNDAPDDCNALLQRLLQAFQVLTTLRAVQEVAEQKYGREARTHRWLEDMLDLLDEEREKLEEEIDKAYPGSEEKEELRDQLDQLNALGKEFELEDFPSYWAAERLWNDYLRAVSASAKQQEVCEELSDAYRKHCHKKGPAITSSAAVDVPPKPKIPQFRWVFQPPPPKNAVSVKAPEGISSDEFIKRTRKTIAGWRELADKWPKGSPDNEKYTAEADRLQNMLDHPAAWLK